MQGMNYNSGDFISSESHLGGVLLLLTFSLYQESVTPTPNFRKNVNKQSCMVCIRRNPEAAVK